MKTIIGLGSNMGDRQKYLDAAIAQIEARAGRVTARSSVYETEAYGYTDQAAFLNMAIMAETELEPYALLKELNAIEAELDRVRTIRWGPRTIDLDILFYEDLLLDDERLKIPHIDLHNRFFVLEPVAEIAGDYYDVRRKKTVNRLLEELREQNEQ